MSAWARESRSTRISGKPWFELQRTRQHKRGGLNEGDFNYHWLIGSWQQRGAPGPAGILFLKISFWPINLGACLNMIPEVVVVSLCTPSPGALRGVEIIHLVFEGRTQFCQLWPVETG